MVFVIAILLRVALVLGLATALLGPRVAGLSPRWTKAGWTTVLVAALLLVFIRVGVRVAMPEALPSSSG